MSLLSRASRTAGRLADELSGGMRQHMPIGNAMTGGVLGAGVGAAANPSDPLQGALAGGAIGAGALSAGPVANLLRRGVRGAAEEFGAAPRIAQELRRMGAEKGSDAAYAQLRELRMADPQLADEVEAYLMATSGR